MLTPIVIFLISYHLTLKHLGFAHFMSSTSSPMFGTWWALKYLLNERMRAESCRVVMGAMAEIGKLERGGILVERGVLLWIVTLGLSGGW